MKRSNPRDKSLGLNAESPAVVGLDIACLDLFGQSGRTNLHDPSTNLIEKRWASSFNCFDSVRIRTTCSLGTQ